MSTEINGNGRAINPEGVYKHKESGATVVLESSPGVGTPMIDAYIQAGYVYAGDQEVVKPAPVVIAPQVDVDQVVAKTKK